MRAKMYGKDEDSQSSNQVLLDIEPSEREDEWSLPDRGSEWGSILEGIGDD
jgi:hypothetical protein